jgi:hypothetical protein
VDIPLWDWEKGGYEPKEGGVDPADFMDDPGMVKLYRNLKGTMPVHEFTRYLLNDLYVASEFARVSVNIEINLENPKKGDKYLKRIEDLNRLMAEGKVSEKDYEILSEQFFADYLLQFSEEQQMEILRGMGLIEVDISEIVDDLNDSDENFMNDLDDSYDDGEVDEF